MELRPEDNLPSYGDTTTAYNYCLSHKGAASRRKEDRLTVEELKLDSNALILAPKNLIQKKA